MERRSSAEGPRHYAFDGTGIAGYDPETGMVIDPWVDAAKALPAGLRSGTESSVGAGGDVRSLQDRAIDWVLDKTGDPLGERDRLHWITSNHTMWSRLPSTEGIRRRATNPVLGEGYQPKTTFGEFAHTGGEFAGGALIPGGPVRKAAMVVGPTVASETAGQLTEGTAWEPWARFSGALLGGSVAAVKTAPREAVRATTGPRVLPREKTGLIRALQQQGYSPDEIKRALTAFDGTGANPRQGTQPRLAAAEHSPVVEASPAFGEVAATERVRAAHEMPPATALDDWRQRAAAKLSAQLDGSKPQYYVDGPTKWLGPLGVAHGPTITQTRRALKKAKKKDAHHFVQEAAVKHFPGYNTWAAPTIHLEGPASIKGTPHYHATQLQRRLEGGTLGAEILNGAEIAEEIARLPPALRDHALSEVGEYFKFLGLKADTPTPIPGNRRRPK